MKSQNPQDLTSNNDNEEERNLQQNEQPADEVKEELKITEGSEERGEADVAGVEVEADTIVEVVSDEEVVEDETAEAEADVEEVPDTVEADAEIEVDATVEAEAGAAKEIEAETDVEKVPDAAEADAAIEVEVDATVEVETDVDVELDETVEADAPVETGADAEIEADTTVEAVADSEEAVEAMPDAAEANAAIELKADATVEAVADSEEADGAIEVEVDTKVEAETDVDVEVDATVEVDSEADVEAEVTTDAAGDMSKQPFEERPWLKHYPNEISSSLEYPKVNIAQFLIDAAVQFPSHKAIQFMGKSYTYEKLYAAADTLARQLGRYGVHKGDRVAIMLPNCPQAVIAYYGVLLAGAIVVQTNPLYVERELKQQLLDCGAIALITLDLLYPRIDKLRGKDFERGALPKLKSVIITSIKDCLPFPKNLLYPIKQKREGFTSVIPYGENGYVSWSSLFHRKALSYERPTLAEHDEIAAIQYTGGTTGTPKGVMLSHYNLVANTMQTMEWCSRVKVGEERYLSALPLFHVFGLTVLMNMSVRSAGCLILLPKFEVNEVLRTIEKTKPTIFPGAPTMYVGIIQAASKLEKLDLSSIEVCISGSAALPLEVQEQFELLTGGRLIEGYGLTEASPVTHANPIWGKRKIGTIGLPFPDTDGAIINQETGERLRPGQLGELIVKGPQVMQGYWNKQEATEQVLQDGWLKTGDLAQMDDEGYFIIMDRIKDIIIAGGYNIYPREIEEVLFEHPAIAEAAVVGVKDMYRGETVKAFIVLKDNAAVSQEQLNAWCRDRLAAYKVPHLYEFKESLPKTMVGKVLKRKLIEEERQHE